MLPKKKIDPENQSILNLALRCSFITSQQNDEIADHLLDRLRQNTDFSVIEIFKEKELLSQDNIDFLFSIKEHLDTKMLDKKFGQLAVANHFTSPDNIKKAPELQAPNSDVVASAITAFKGIYLKNVYSNGTTPSVLKIGREPNRRIKAIQETIEKKAAQLRAFNHQDELDELSRQFHNQAQLQNDYREKLDSLFFIIKILENEAPAHLETLEEKLEFFEKQPENPGESNTYLRIPKNTNAYQYIIDTIKEINGISIKKQRADPGKV